MRTLAATLFLTAILSVTFVGAAPPAPKAIASQDVLQHLNQTIAWYQHLNSIDQSASAPENILLQDNTRETAKKVVQFAFAFAHAEASVLMKGANPSSDASPVPAESRNLEQAVSQANDRVAKLQAQIDALNQQIDKQVGRKRATLLSRRNALAADLTLAKEFQSAVSNVVSFGRGPNVKNGGGGLLAQINDLEISDSVPAALNPTSKTSPAQTNASQVFHPESAGIVTLIAKAVAFADARMQIDSAISETGALLAEIDRLKAPLRTVLRGAISQGDTIAQAADAQTDSTQLDTARKQLDSLAAAFKAVSGVMMPLGEQGILLQASRAGLTDWRNAVDRQYDSALRYLAIRLGVLAFAIVLLLFFSQLWYRAIFRYVRDARRRRQFMLVRRFVVTFAVVLIVALGFFTSVSSVATFAGFITAGLAVALQNVILSVVAYFFLIGRYGLRVGDRVTVAGVTGQVIDIGLVRFSVMEFAGAGVDVHMSGRVAVFANSIILQASALLKQAPGTEYMWHAVAITLVPETECEAARARLTAAVESVYNEYREIIDRQHAAFEKSLSIQLTAPKPVSRIHFTDAGCEVFIRYPVEMERASEIDERIEKQLLKEVEQEPPLKLASGGAPKTVSAT